MYLISACLCGVNCKYSGKNNLNDRCLKLLRDGKAILVCPEQLGGLSTPREPAEIIGSPKEVLEGTDGKIISISGKDVTEEFLKGAKETLKIAKAIGAKKAILKEGSPSCGCNFIYGGSFSGNKIRGKGLTAYMLEREGIKVISEKEEF